MAKVKKIAHTARFLLLFHSAGNGLPADLEPTEVVAPSLVEPVVDAPEIYSHGDTKFLRCGNRAAHGTVATYHTKDEIKACFAARWGN